MPNWKVLKEHMKKEGSLHKADLIKLIRLVIEVFRELTRQ